QEDGRRPVYGGSEKFQRDPHWRDLILFYEYFHGDNGAGIGASHQTGWTGLRAEVPPQSRGEARAPAKRPPRAETKRAAHQRDRAQRSWRGDGSRSTLDGVKAWGGVTLVIIAAGLIRLRLLDVPLDRDEGEYAYIAHLLLAGALPYASACSMKLPGIYAVYAGLLKIFGET